MPENDPGLRAGLDFSSAGRAISTGRQRAEFTPAEVKEFEDFVMRQLVAFAAKHDLPFQIHTGDARSIQGSNSMLPST